MASSEKQQKQQQRPRAARRHPRGQAMVEYSVITHFGLIGAAAGLLPVVTRFMNAISSFYDSVYTVLQTAAI